MKTICTPIHFHQIHVFTNCLLWFSWMFPLKSPSLSWISSVSARIISLRFVMVCTVIACTKFTNMFNVILSSTSNQTVPIAGQFSPCSCFLRPQFLQVSNQGCRPLWGCFVSMWVTSLSFLAAFHLGFLLPFIFFKWILESLYRFAVFIVWSKVKLLTVVINVSLICDERMTYTTLSLKFNKNFHNHSLSQTLVMLWKTSHKFSFHFESYYDTRIA